MSFLYDTRRQLFGQENVHNIGSFWKRKKNIKTPQLNCMLFFQNNRNFVDFANTFKDAFQNHMDPAISAFANMHMLSEANSQNSA